jgi:hypothetical protein
VKSIHLRIALHEPLTMTGRINAYQLVRILELHRRGNLTDQIAHQVFGSDDETLAVEKVLEAYGQAPQKGGAAPKLDGSRSLPSDSVRLSARVSLSRLWR